MATKKSKQRERNLKNLKLIYGTKYDYIGLNALFVFSGVNKYFEEQNIKATPLKCYIVCIIIYCYYNQLPVTKVNIFDILKRLNLTGSLQYCYLTIEELIKGGFINPLRVRTGKPFEKSTYQPTIKFKTLIQFVNNHFNKLAANIERNKFKKSNISLDL